MAFAAPPLFDLQVAVYRMIGAPLLRGTLNASLIAPGAALTAFNAVAAVGVPTVTGPDIGELGPSTDPFSAVTVNR